jgi:hypothetical protein
VAKVEWHPSELYPRVGFIVTNLARQLCLHFAAIRRRLRAPFVSGYGDLPLPKPVKGAILPSKTPGSGEYRVSRSCPPGSATD